MTLYFSDRQIPELSTLDNSQRRLVWKGGIKLFFLEHPAARWKYHLVNLFALVIALTVASCSFHQFFLRVLIGTSVGFLIMTFFHSLRTERLRPYLRRYIAEHSEELWL